VSDVEHDMTSNSQVRSKLAMWWALAVSMLLGATALAQGVSADQVTTDLVSLSKQVPAKVSVGEPYTVVLTVKAVQQVANVVVKDQVPAGAQLQSSEPKATVAGAEVSWKLDALAAGESREFKLVLVAQGEGTLKSCATATAEPRICVGTVVGKPVLAIEKSGPAEATLGSQFSYTVVVKNTGTSDAKGVVVTVTLPAGLKPVSGTSPLTFEVGDLPAGAQKQLSVPVIAEQRGRFCNVATFKSANAGEGRAEACTVVVQPAIKITKSGTPKQFVGKTADYSIVVENPGDVLLTNVVVTDTAPAGTRIEKAEGATVNGQTATWTLPELKPGEKVTKSLTLMGLQQGNLCNQVAVTSTQGQKGQAEACTVWIGHPAVLIEVVDTNDPLMVKDQTVYIITVTNQGTADDTNVKIVANFPAQISPVSATGDTQATVNGQTVDTAPYPVLKPKQAITWKITAEAKQMGDSRLKVLLSTDLLKTPVTEEESTQVY
jgi:uncharacterized repeat protein (TIGR01451 family)